MLSEHNNDYAGSGRGYEKKDIKDLKKWCNDTKLFNYAEGHANSFGLSISNQLINKLYETAKTVKTSDVLLYDVDGIFNQLNLSKTLIESIAKYKNIWGATLKEPLFAIENVYVNVTCVELTGSKSNTLKINCNGINFIKYHTDKELYEDIKQHQAITMTVIGKFNVSEYKGKSTSQVIIEDMIFEPCKVKFGFY